MTYQDDDIWVASKKLAEISGNKNNWTSVMTYYNLGGGLHVKLAVLDKDNGDYRFIANTDTGYSLCLSRNGKKEYIPIDTVIEYKKIFEFIEEPGELTETGTEEPVNGFYKVRYIK